MRRAPSGAHLGSDARPHRPPDRGAGSVGRRPSAAASLGGQRQGARPGNRGEADGALLEEIAAPDRSGLTLLREAANSLSLSARGYHRTLRVARTLADLCGEEKVARIHVAEALSYRGETLRRAQAAA